MQNKKILKNNDNIKVKQNERYCYIGDVEMSNNEMKDIDLISAVL